MNQDADLNLPGIFHFVGAGLAASARSAAVPGPNLGLESGFRHRPGACSRNWRRDAAVTRRRDACATT